MACALELWAEINGHCICAEQNKKIGKQLKHVPEKCKTSTSQHFRRVRPALKGAPIRSSSSS